MKVLNRCWLWSLGAGLTPFLFASASFGQAAVPVVPTGHSVFDLHANRTLAHIEQRGGLVLIGGSAGFARYAHFGRPTPSWKLRSEVDGKKVALPTTAARLQVPLHPGQTQNQTVFLSLKSPSKSSLKISVGGKSSAAVPLNEGWQLVTVPLPADSLHAGENTLSLTFAQSGTFALGGGSGSHKAAAAVEWIQVGGSTPPANAPLPKLSDGSRLLIPSGGALHYYAFVPKGGALALKGDGGACSLKVTVDGPQPGQRGASQTASLDGVPLSLTSHAGEIRRIGLRAEGSCDKLALDKAQLLAGGAAPPPLKIEKPRNVVFWLSDDTRADKFKLWNKSSRVDTPVLDEFSKRATRFAVTYSQGNESRVSHASLFTGLYPATHKFISDKAVLPDSFTIIPEVMKQAGLYTIAHIANGYITKRWGFGDGWDVLKNHIHEGGGLKSAELVGDAKQFLEKGPGKSKPFFLYLGTIDAHVSWRTYEPWISKYDPTPYNGPFMKGCMDPQLDKIVAGQLTVTARDRQRVLALYECDISYNDHHFGKLLELLKQTGHENDTMIIYTSDHGEEFWDHGRIGHGQSLRQELIHIPLWIYYPPLFPGGKVVEEGAELVDILPTMAEAFGQPIPKDVQGESLISVAQGLGQGYPRPAIASQYELAHVMRLSRYKLWVGGSGQVKLYNGQDDPGEQHELNQTEPLALRFVTDAMGMWMAYQGQWKKSRWGVASNHRPELAADLDK